MSKDAVQSYPQMAEVCIFGGSAEGGKPFARGPGDAIPLDGVQR